MGLAYLAGHQRATNKEYGAAAGIAVDTAIERQIRKLDRQALPAPGMAALAARAYVAPEGELEETLAAIWQALLGVTRIGRDDNFFELGGHSLMAVRLLARIREQCLVDVPLRALFESPVLSDLAALLMAQQFKTFMPADISSMSDALDDLSEEELMALLAEERPDEA